MVIEREPCSGPAFVFKVAEGLGNPSQARQWRRRAKARIRDLRADQVDVGLTPAERRELQQLERLVPARIDQLDIWAALLVLAIVVATIWAAGFVK